VTEPTKEQKFLEQQYIALRTEKEQASERAFKIFAASVLVVPTGLALGRAVGDDVRPLILMLLPLLLLAFYAMYCAQILSTRRTGLYIESHIEPSLLHRTRGWESWLSERRYAYDAQMNVAFFLLAAVYYLGAAYIAAWAGVGKDAHLEDLKHFLSFADPKKAVLPFQVSVSNEWMLFNFYALAGLAMFFLVQLVPDRQLKEEERIKQIFRSKPVRCKPDDLQKLFLNKVKPTFRKKVWPQVGAFFYSKVKAFFRRGHITREDYHTETSRHVSKPQHVRLTISEGLTQNMTTTMVGLATMLVLLLWAVMSIQRFYQEFTLLPDTSDTSVIIFTLLSLGVLLVLLVILYYRLVGKNIGAKIDIRFRPAKQPADSHWADSHWARYIVQTSLEPADYEWLSKTANYEWLSKMVKRGLEETLKEEWMTIECLERRWDLGDDVGNTDNS